MLAAADAVVVAGEVADDVDCSCTTAEGSGFVVGGTASAADDCGRTRGEEKAFEDENWMPP